ncbi:MAG: molybdopterin-guanine dinucleotide biosynthesis protein B [Archaeoglobus sp.]|uniref:molybdopterin-guanine dinucleotide biosynthesis protein B n=1 Tax=Archaeoglobus sp. TaxID=1872626 RepID=UPI001E118876|nr:molybdopterin-guanine dinucleotide biosynthesis protein B [Archaeoglobus sp.]MBO8179919.1 molybdopterin-guanine dinucleotide biosynthesis protein B [Archaeoglobus sp.]
MLLSIVGTSDSGKTTLITRIMPILKEKGLRVAVVKRHAHGDFEIDKEGKDSWKIYNSGADVVIASPVKLAFIRRVSEEEGNNLDWIYERYLSDYDLVITEGFSKAGKDRIVVVKKPEEVELFKQGRILAVVCDEKIEGYTWFRRDEVERIADFILSLQKQGR